MKLEAEERHPRPSRGQAVDKPRKILQCCSTDGAVRACLRVGAHPMANAKIISFVDHAITAALDPVHDDIEAQRADIMRSIAVLTDRIRDTRLSLTNAIADNTLTLRHDINALAAAINELRTDVDQLKQGGEPRNHECLIATPTIKRSTEIGIGTQLRADTPERMIQKVAGRHPPDKASIENASILARTTRVAAAEALLDRGWGTPKQTIATAPEDGPLIVEIIQRVREPREPK